MIHIAGKNTLSDLIRELKTKLDRRYAQSVDFANFQTIVDQKQDRIRLRTETPVLEQEPDSKDGTIYLVVEE